MGLGHPMATLCHTNRPCDRPGWTWGSALSDLADVVPLQIFVKPDYFAAMRFKVLSYSLESSGVRRGMLQLSFRELPRISSRSTGLFLGTAAATDTLLLIG